MIISLSANLLTLMCLDIKRLHFIADDLTRAGGIGNVTFLGSDASNTENLYREEIGYV